jgi:hypothetical protein
MANASDYLREARSHANLDPDEAMGLVVDFLSTYGMTEQAALHLCDFVDDEGMAADFRNVLVENGIMAEDSIALGKEEILTDDDEDE